MWSRPRRIDWGLRDYGLPPIVWGGDSSCEHDWGSLGETLKGGHAGDHVGLEGGREKILQAQATVRTVNNGSVCCKCGAWRGQLGLEPTPGLFVQHMVEIFREVRRVLRGDGVCWVNLGDCYGGVRGNKTPAPDNKNRHKNADTPGDSKGRTTRKQLIGIPWRVALAMQEDGWILRSDCIWHKPNSMPQSVTDRPSGDHEYIFLFAKSKRYFFDQEAVKVRASTNSHPRGSGVNPKAIEGTGTGTRQNASFSAAVSGIVESRNLRTVWKISSHPFKGAHFATFPPKLVEPCIKAGTSEKGCCPHCGAPWQRMVEKVRVPTRPGTKTKVAGANSRFFKSRDPSHVTEHEGKTRTDGIAPGNRASQHETSPYNEHSGMIVGNRDPHRHITATQTVGWEPTCKCEVGDPVPCTVLDPFLGSGTTAIVAEYLGRNWIGTELNEQYAAMARERIAAGYTPPKQKSGGRMRKVRAL